MPEMRPEEVRVGIVAIPEATIGTLSGVFDVLNGLAMLAGREGIPERSPFRVEILGETTYPVRLASGIALPVHGAATEASSDVVVVPSLLLPASGWTRGRYPAIANWLLARHAAGATLCSACSGIFLLAETGLFNGVEATVHWPYARAFGALFPEVRACPDRALVVAGARGELVSSGASTSWHDLVLYLVGREVGPAAAQAISKFFALQHHADGLAPFIVFDPPRDHGDALIVAAQDWLDTHAGIAAPVREAMRRSGLSERGFARRFRAATGHAPLEYVQRLRIEQAKRRLERTGEPVEDVAWRVGYEDPAAFRRLFRRLAGISPGRYRRQFTLPVR